MKIQVPATSANLGPGFDSCGIALAKYLVIEVIEPQATWEIIHHLGDEIPNDESNLLIQTALQVAPNIMPHQLRMISDIPLTRGLGSSSSVIVAGIELANRLANLNLSDEEKLKIATKIEGHPDNVAPAIFGDFVVACYDEEKDEVLSVKHYFPECDIIAYIPNTELLTKESRQVLPKTFNYQEAVKASAIANVMIGAIINGNLALAGQLMERDLFHEKYRAKLVPHLGKIRQICQQNQTFGCFLSGAGPTVLILAPKDCSEKIMLQLSLIDSHAQVEQVCIDREGVQVF